MKTKFLAVMMGVALTAASGVACAQFGGLGKVAGIGGDAAGASVSSEQIVDKYIGGAQNVNKADVKMLLAVGLKDEAGKAELAGKNLTAGATKDSLENASKTQTESSKALEAKFKDKQVNMDAKSKRRCECPSPIGLLLLEIKIRVNKMHSCPARPLLLFFHWHGDHT